MAICIAALFVETLYIGPYTRQPMQVRIVASTRLSNNRAHVAKSAHSSEARLFTPIHHEPQCTAASLHQENDFVFEAQTSISPQGGRRRGGLT